MSEQGFEPRAVELLELAPLVRAERDAEQLACDLDRLAPTFFPTFFPAFSETRTATSPLSGALEPIEPAVALGVERIDYRVVGRGGVEQGAHGYRSDEYGIFEQGRAGERDPLLSIGRPLANLTPLDEDRDDATHPAGTQILRPLSNFALGLLVDHLERKLFEITNVGGGIDASATNAGVGGEVGGRTRAGEEIAGGDITLSYVGPHDIIEVAVAVGMRWQSWPGSNWPATHHLLPRLGPHEVLVDRGPRPTETL